MALVAALAWLLAAFPLTVTCVELDAQVTALDDPGAGPAKEMPKDVAYPYDKWAAEAQALEQTFPPPPKQPTSQSVRAENQRWVLKKGLKMKHLNAKTEYQAYIQKAKDDKDAAAEKKRASDILHAAIKRSRAAEQFKASQASKNKGQDDQAIAAGAAEVKNKETVASDSDPSRVVLLQTSLTAGNSSKARVGPSVIVESAKKGLHLNPTTEVCRIAKKGLDNICRMEGTGSKRCVGGHKTYSKKCSTPDDSKEPVDHSKPVIKTAVTKPPKPAINKPVAKKSGTTVHVKAGSSLHQEAMTSVHVKQGSSLHQAASTSIHVKEGSSLHQAATTSVHVKDGSSLHQAATSSSAGNDKTGDTSKPAADKKGTKYYGKEDQLLHRKDASHNMNSDIPHELQKEARHHVRAVADQAADKAPNADTPAFRKYRDAVVNSAVRAAAPKIAELKHKAVIKGRIAVRDAKTEAKKDVSNAEKDEAEQKEDKKRAEAEAKASKQVAKAEARTIEKQGKPTS